MLAKAAVLCVAACMPMVAGAAVGSLDLSNYSLTATYSLPYPAASEASAVTWNWDTGTLFVVGDEGDQLVEVSTTGTLLSSMTLTGFDDTEGLTYIGGGQFVITEERIQDAYRLTYAAGGSASRGSLPGVSLGPTVGNVGIEGLSFDPQTGQFIVVKEKTPQAVYDAVLDFPNGTASVNSLFTPALGVLDLSDVQVLSTVAAPGSGDLENLLLYSQESALLMEVDRSGNLLSSFDFSGIAGDAEGVTIDANGTIYIVGEEPELYVLSPNPVPLPAAAWLMLSGAGGLLAFARRRG